MYPIAASVEIMKPVNRKPFQVSALNLSLDPGAGFTDAEFPLSFKGKFD
jgi:hypothetical protein